MAENIKRKALAVISALAGLMFFVALIFFFTGGGAQQAGTSRNSGVTLHAPPDTAPVPAQTLPKN